MANTEADLANLQSLGLLGMKERAALLGGEVVFHACPGRGTTVITRLPQNGAVGFGNPMP